MDFHSEARPTATVEGRARLRGAATPQDFGIEWNAENQLVRVTKDTAEVGRYAYDPIGRRVEKVAGANTNGYAYDGVDILRQASGGRVVRYVQGPRIDEPLAAEDAGGQLVYEHADELGSQVKSTDGSGAVTASRTYEAFGGPGASSASERYAYTGREWDPETGLYYYRARYYDPKLGRFISEDPIGFDGGANAYGYVEQNPVRYFDPMGLYHCYYYVDRHTLVCEPDQPNHPRFVTDNVTSGQNGGEVIDPARGRMYSECYDCQDNPRREGRAGRGPIPRRDYRMGRRGADPRHPTWLPLRPDPIPRTSFYVHFCPPAKFATCSEGCLGVTSASDWKEFNRLMTLESINTMSVRSDASRHRCQNCR